VWVAESQYEVLGTRYGVRSDDEQAAAWVERLLSPFQAPMRKAVRAKNLFALASRRPGDERHHAFRDCKRIGRSESWTRVLDQFLGELNRRAVDDMKYFGVHAGVIASGERTIALPGGSGAGKTTLVAACLQAGFHYVSDEALCLDYSTRAVVSYPKPLNLSGWSIDALQVDASGIDPVSDGSKTPVHPEAVGGVIALAPPELSDLVIFERRPGPAQLEELPRSQVVRALLGYSFNHYERPADAFRLTTELARRCKGWALTYDNPIEAARLLRSAL
jgi:serine kinase of HPr protein (carbohydrate metabolism regulator)